MTENWKTNYKGQRFLSEERTDVIEDLINHINNADWRMNDSFKAALEDVAKKMPDKVTIGALAREFPRYKGMLMDIVETLSEIKFLNFDDFKPMPTILTVNNKENAVI